MPKADVSARTIWGRTVLFLKEKKHVALHVASGDITDVEIVDMKFVARCEDEMLFELLSKEKQLIENSFAYQGLDLEFMVERKFIEKSDFEKDLKKLSEFNQFIKIKE